MEGLTSARPRATYYPTSCDLLEVSRAPIGGVDNGGDILPPLVEDRDQLFVAGGRN
jgi:hypothetical protein